MAARKKLSFATFNLYNINEPLIPVYSDSDGWSEEEYEKKTDWMASMLRTLDSDVWAFQELWHYKSLVTAFKKAKLYSQYTLLAPKTHQGTRIICAGAVRKEYLTGDPEWIEEFPDEFVLQSGGDDPQTSDISVSLNTFSRPVLHFSIRPRTNGKPIQVYVVHFKSKGPEKVYREAWFNENREFYKHHAQTLGGALSTIRRTAEAAALRMILTGVMKKTDHPVVVLGDFNDSQGSNTLNILTGQPNYLLSGLSKGGSDTALYSTGTLQEYRSQRDVYYTHVYKNKRESLDHILVSQEFYDNSKKRLWAFDGMELFNDHLNRDDHKETGTTDHGIVRASFHYRPA